MNKNDIQLLYEYNRWANARMLKAVSALSPGHFAKDLSSSYRSVQDTLTHILSGEWIWLMRWQGLSPKAMFRPVDFQSCDSLMRKWAEIEREQTNFIQGVRPTSPSRK